MGKLSLKDLKNCLKLDREILEQFGNALILSQANPMPLNNNHFRARQNLHSPTNTKF